MMIIWGKTRRQKRIGLVADICSICREIRPFEMFSISITRHLYYFTIGHGKTIGFIGVCQECSIERPLNAQKYHKTLYKDPETLRHLISETNPDIYESHKIRLEFEDKIKRKEYLDKDDRDYFISEPFVVISPMLEERFGESTKFDKKSGRSCAITLAIPFVFLCISMFFINQMIIDTIKILAAIFVIIGIIVTVVFIFFTHRRYLDRIIYPALAKSLDPLNPSLDDIKTILDRYKNLDLYIGKRIDSKRIIEEINELRTSKYK